MIDTFNKLQNLKIESNKLLFQTNNTVFNLKQKLLYCTNNKNTIL